MKLLGVIAEYDPFHSGHRYHLHTARQVSDAEGVLVLMSGSAVQRGGLAFDDKWHRAETAVRNGADLVCELPYVYAGQTAELFARGGVALLNVAGCEGISFGTEVDDLSQLDEVASLLAEEPSSYRMALHDAMDRGSSYPSARQQACEKLLGKNVAKVLRSPNATLAIEYLKTIKQTGSQMKAYPVQRKGAGHDDWNKEASFLSASAIRESLIQHKGDEIQGALPYHINAFDITKITARRKAAEQLILSKLLTGTPESLRELPDVTEGLEFALINAVKEEYRADKIIERVASKRIPKSRIRRILIHLCMNFTKNDLEMLSKPGEPHYLRVLAFNEKGQEILRTLRDGETPVLTNLHSNQKKLNDKGKEALHFDCLASDLFYLLGNEPEKIHADYRKSGVRH